MRLGDILSRSEKRALRNIALDAAARRFSKAIKRTIRARSGK